jgi:hypothetical protein
MKMGISVADRCARVDQNAVGSAYNVIAICSASYHREESVDLQ